MSRTPGDRYHPLPASFFTAPPTAGLSPLAACLLLRASAESLVGVLTRSPRVLGAAHGVGEAAVLSAIAELERRGLVAWYPADELLVTIGGGRRGAGSARRAAELQVAALPEAAQAAALGVPGVAPGVAGGPGPNEQEQEQEQDQEHQPRARKRARRGVDAMQARKQRPAIRQDAQPVVDRLMQLREGLGMRPLSPSELADTHICRRIDEGISVADLMRVLELRAAEIEKADPDHPSRRYFDLVSPFTGPGPRGPGGWAISRGMLDADAARRKAPKLGRYVPPGGQTIEQIEASRRREPKPVESIDDEFPPSWEDLGPWCDP